MDRSVQAATTQLDESTLRTWDDMRSQVLHELQEGATVPDALVESKSQLVIMLKFWRFLQGPMAAPKAS